MIYWEYVVQYPISNPIQKIQSYSEISLKYGYMEIYGNPIYIFGNIWESRFIQSYSEISLQYGNIYIYIWKYYKKKTIVKSQLANVPSKAWLFWRQFARRGRGAQYRFRMPAEVWPFFKMPMTVGIGGRTNCFWMYVYIYIHIILYRYYIDII